MRSTTTSRTFYGSLDSTLSEIRAQSKLIDFTAGLGFLSARDRARVQRRGERAFRKAGRRALQEAEAKGRASPKSELTTGPAQVASPPAAHPAAPGSFQQVQQECAFRLVPLARAQETRSIKYHGIFNTHFHAYKGFTHV